VKRRDKETDIKSMKRFHLAVLLLVLGMTILGAQPVYLLNETDATLYLLHTPDGGGAEQLELVPDGSYRQVPPGGVLPIPETGSLAGFAYARGSFQLPTFFVRQARRDAISSVAASGRRYVSISADELRTDRIVSPSDFASLLALPRVDNQYLDWIARDPRIARGRSRAPLGVFADFGTGREATELDESLLWGRGGTDLQWVKSESTGQDYFLGVTAYSEFSNSTSLFLYIYSGDETLPRATLELPARGRAGLVLLWEPAAPQPRVAGNVVNNDFFMEAQIWRDILAGVVNVALDGVSVELATASSAAGIWEEFVLARDDFVVLFDE